MVQGALRTTVGPDCDARFRVRIGEIDVSVRGDDPAAVEEFGRIYAGYPKTTEQGGSSIEMRLRRTPGRIFEKAKFQILGDGAEIGPPQRHEGVVPCLEWGINFRVVARRSEFLQVHAAVLSRNGEGLLLAADSGGGKSTLACGLLAQGWKYLSDEFALIDPRTLQVHSFPKAICLKQGSFQVVEKMNVHVGREHHWVKGIKGAVSYVTPLQFGLEAIGSPCPIRRVFFVYHQPSRRPAVRSLKQSEAVYELARHSMNRTRFGPEAVRVHSKLVRSAECMVLRAGALQATCDFLDEHCAS